MNPLFRLKGSRIARVWTWISASWAMHVILAVAVMTVVFLHPPKVFSGDTDTARNYLNTIVSSLSTILALCISIILVAIQLTASNYTHRVLDFFVRLPYNASLFLFYMVTIMHSFFLMTRIQEPVHDPLSSGLIREMSADLILVGICFVNLLFYMYAVVQLLKPERIIDLIVREYNRAYTRKRYRAALDNVEQICDIAKRAASFSDSITGMRCIEVMLDIAARLPLPTDEQDPLLEIHRNLVDQWVEIVGVAVKEKETGMLHGVLDALHVQGCRYIDRKAWRAAELVIRAYRHLTFHHLLVEGQVFYAERVAHRLYKLGLSAAEAGERGQTFTIRTWRVITSIGESTFATQPSSMSALSSGFLTVTEMESTWRRLIGEDRKAEAFALYFTLWKAFIEVATQRDAARWALWWRDMVHGDGLKHLGQRVSFAILQHLDKARMIETLQQVWGTSPAAGVLIPDAIRNYGMDLLDGWPWPEPPEAEVTASEGPFSPEFRT